MKTSRLQAPLLLLLSCVLSACGQQATKTANRVTVATVQSKPVTLTEQYTCNLQGHLHITIRTPATGIVEAVQVKDGQSVKKDDLLFKVKPAKAKDLSRADAEDKLISIKAPFDGRVDTLAQQQGSGVLEGETLTTLTDNSVVWAYFNVPEKRYLDYKVASPDKLLESVKFDLILKDGSKFGQPGKLGAVDADFNRQTGSVAFRADFPNPDLKLRHGLTGILELTHVQQDAIVIPQRATFEVLQRRYVYVVDKDGIAHKREIVLQSEVDDQFVVKAGLSVDDKVVVDGVGRIGDGVKVDYDDGQSTKTVANVK